MYMHKIKKLHEVIFSLFLGCYFKTSCVGERCTGWLTFFIFALKVLLFDVLSRTWSYKIE